VSEWHRWKIPPAGYFSGSTTHGLNDAGELARLDCARLTAAFHFAQRKFGFDISMIRRSFPA
jgi:hypothetical protein